MLVKPPLIVNFDDSVGGVEDAVRLDFSAWQEKIRFGCSQKVYQGFCAQLERALPHNYGIVFLGSGDYHHISYALIKRQIRHLAGQARSEGKPAVKMRVVVADNHPDNMRYPFGIHCGSWVSHVAALPEIARVDVLGITSGDITAAHMAENRLLPLLRGKLRYWSVGAPVFWGKLLGLGASFRSFATAEMLVAAFLAENMAEPPLPIYFSLDKDVLSPAELQTNWDQGVMTEKVLFELIHKLKPAIIAGDVTGEVSEYIYRSPFKRLMSFLDGQRQLPPGEVYEWQKRQADFNRDFLSPVRSV